jgi:hypothetical protein
MRLKTLASSVSYRNPCLEVAGCHEVDRVGEPVDSSSDAASDEESQNDRRHHGDTEQQSKRLEIARVEAHSPFLELGVRIMDVPGPLELPLVAPIEGEDRDERRTCPVDAQRPTDLELALGRVVDRVAAIA